MSLVSIIVPVYNAERFLREALESVLAQTWKDFEIIIVDDGSGDGTRAISEDFVRKHPEKVHYAYQTNSGPGAARNYGMRIARGTYLAFLDSDDVWLPDKLRRQVSVLERKPEVGMVYCNNYWVNRRGQINVAKKKTLRYRGNITTDLFNRYFIFPSGVLLRTACANGIRNFRRDIFVGEDYDFFLRFTYHYPVEVIYDRLFCKRTLMESLSNLDFTINSRNDIDILTRFSREHPAFSQRYHVLVSERLWEYHFSLAYYCLRQGRNRTALRYSAASLKYRLSAKSIKCLILSLIPYEAVCFIKAHYFQQKFEAPRTESADLQ